MFARLAQDNLRGGLHDPLEVLGPNGVHVRVGRGVAEVNRQRLAVAHGELHRVEVVAEVLVELEHVVVHAVPQALGRVEVRHVAQVEGIARLVRHDPHVALVDAVAAVVLLELHLLLQHHHELTRLGVSLEELVRVFQLVDVLPPAACERLEVRREADVIEDCAPIHREREVAE